ncbi:glutamine synthetase family protein [Hyphomicrobium sp.]|uniref:glutamine synthetase family protein n=1 Tax=Hyphomicrobium sp. TaxID=82 RepID=UPI000FBC8531|nr:glutamine synthetase family protein [Hyphomicrobium sp.]RUO97914.1 MAG: glutamine synthetase [Hyphomicrobium sp.]
MTDNFLTVEEASEFLDANPTVSWIDILLFDMNGMPRGKRMRRGDLLGAAKNGLLLPASVYVLDPRGNSIAETGRLWETGDHDIPFRVLSGTLRPVPVGNRTHAQGVMVPVDACDMDPRAVLATQVDRLAQAGQKPIVAVELEFYVTRRMPDGNFSLVTPPGLSADPERPMTFGFEEMDSLGPFIDDVYRIADAQGLPVDAVMQESGPGQFEINLKHSEAMTAALDGVLLKRAVKAAARAHDLEATFMAKPHHDWTGSGMHIHVSLIDPQGNNLFAGDPMAPMFRHAIGGLQASMPDFMAVWAQSANAYRRYVPESYVPMAAHWGFNNRTVALRVPCCSGPATRIEHRVSGADANPFLVIAAILGGVRHGLINRIDPGQHAEGNAEELDGPTLPTSWVNALSRFRSSDIVRDAFGATFQDIYYRLKETERISFERIVTSLDYEWYAQVA